MEIDFSTFNLKNIIDNNGQKCFCANYIRGFFDIKQRTFESAMKKLKESVHKFKAQFNGRVVNVLTKKGVEALFIHLNFNHVKDIHKVISDFNDFCKAQSITDVEPTKDMIEPNENGLQCAAAVYILEIGDGLYKFGQTIHISSRLDQHKRELNYRKVVKIFPCDHQRIAQLAESQIKKLMSERGCLTELQRDDTNRKHTEIIKTDQPESWIIETVAPIVEIAHKSYGKTCAINNDKSLMDELKLQRKELLSLRRELAELRFQQIEDATADAYFDDEPDAETGMPEAKIADVDGEKTVVVDVDDDSYYTSADLIAHMLINHGFKVTVGEDFISVTNGRPHHVDQINELIEGLRKHIDPPKVCGQCLKYVKKEKRYCAKCGMDFKRIQH